MRESRQAAEEAESDVREPHQAASGAESDARESHEALPPVWDSTVDEAAGRTYYFNRDMHAVQWERP